MTTTAVASMSTAQARRELRDRLLAGTIEHACDRVPAYRERYGDLGHRVRTVGELSLLPIITKDVMIADPNAFLDPRIESAIVQHTTGTTNVPLHVHRGHAELDYVHRFFAKVLELGRASEFRQSPVCISISGDFHGEPVGVPYPAPVVALDPRTADSSSVSGLFGSLLESGRSAIISGIESQLRIMTCQLVEAGFDFSKSNVVAMSTTGEQITRRLRRWYEATWRAPLIDRYSMTEMIGGGNLCGECLHRHLDPHVIGEVVDPFTREPVSSGFGVLVITCLFPFVQKQPFIRYYTGDLVRIGPHCSVDPLGFQLHGRAQRCVLERTPNGTVPLVSAAEIYDILDDYPDVAASRMFETAFGVSDHSALGHLKFAVEHETAGETISIAISIETRYIPYQHPERARELCSAVQTELVRRHSRLQERLDAGTLTLDIRAVTRGRVKSFFPDWVE